jgi:hypothetical protein
MTLIATPRLPVTPSSKYPFTGHARQHKFFLCSDQDIASRSDRVSVFSPGEGTRGYRSVPPKVKDLVAELQRAGFVDRQRKSSQFCSPERRPADYDLWSFDR